MDKHIEAIRAALDAMDMPDMRYGYSGPYRWKTETIGRDAVALIDRLTAENERYKKWVNDLQSGMYVNCVYCGHRYGPEDEVPSTMADALRRHVEQCPEHPMSRLKAENERMRRERDAAIEWADRLHDNFPLTASGRELRDGYRQWRVPVMAGEGER